MLTPLRVLWPVPRWPGPSPQGGGHCSNQASGPHCWPRAKAESWEVAAPQVARLERPAPARGMRTYPVHWGTFNPGWANAGWG